MTENGNTLVFHTSHQRYLTEDGKHHQSQLTIIVDTSTMKVTNNLGLFQSNYVSHSFDQYVQFDGSTHVLIDHGDAYQRSIVLQKSSDDYGYYSVDLFKILGATGATGANATGVCVGGFEVSSENYIVAINSIDHSLEKKYDSYSTDGLKEDQRDIIICIAPRQNTENGEVKQITLAKYIGTKKIASIPQLVKISDEKFMVLWQEFNLPDYTQGAVKYIYIDKTGKASSQIETMEANTLSTCQPIVVGNEVLWYCNGLGYRTFYTIPIE